MITTFPDTSHHVFPTNPTLAQVTAGLRGAQALITKATQGQSMLDLSYAPCKQWAAITGVPFAGFHWFDTSSVDGQVANALKVLGPNIPLMWDAEADGVTVPRLAEATDKYRAKGGKVTLCYLPHWWWHDHMGSPDLSPLRDRGLRLVASYYGHGYAPGSPGWEAYGNWQPDILQYTNSQQFNGRGVDFNAYPGTVEQLRAVFNGTPTKGTDQMFFGSPDGSDEVYLCDAMESRYIPTPAILDQIRALAVEGWITLQNGGAIRKGWTEEVFGPIKTLDLSPEQIAAIAAAVHLDPAELATALTSVLNETRLKVVTE